MAAVGRREMAHRFLAAVESRNLDAILECFTTDATWQNVPHPPAVGREGIASMLGRILRRSDTVRWDIVTEAYDDTRAWLERVDRFWIDGTEYAVACNGVLDFDPESGLITSLRDYVDLGEWRSRVAHIEF